MVNKFNQLLLIICFMILGGIVSYLENLIGWEYIKLALFIFAILVLVFYAVAILDALCYGFPELPQQKNEDFRAFSEDISDEEISDSENYCRVYDEWRKELEANY